MRIRPHETDTPLATTRMQNVLTRMDKDLFAKTHQEIFPTSLFGNETAI